MQYLNAINPINIKDNQCVFDEFQADNSAHDDFQDIQNLEYDLKQNLKPDSGRALRRFQKYRNRHKSHSKSKLFKPEKNWKHMYGRREKIHRAKQLGKEYPAKCMRKVLFELDCCQLENQQANELYTNTPLGLEEI